MMNRRALLGAIPLLGLAVRAAPAVAQADGAAPFAALEAELKCRLGISVWDLESGRRWSHRAGERFPLCSTFKLLAAAAVLARVDAGREDLARTVRFEASEVVTYSPVTKERAGIGMSMAEICAAAVTLSDNTAGNLMLDSLGGPSALTAFVRSLGDDTTRLDRRETELNEATPGDPRDTTSPDAMVGSLRALLASETLSRRSRDQLEAWLADSRTGAAKLKAGLPADWRIGDKTGAGEFGTTNEVAVIWPPRRRPVLAAIYMTETVASLDRKNAAFASIGRWLAETISS